MESDSLLIPTDIDKFYPYTMTYKVESEEVNVLTAIEDKLFWFNPDSILPKFIFFEDESEEEIPEYGIIPFTKMDKFSVYLELPKAVKLKESITSFNTTNEIGEIKIEATQFNENTIKFNYEINLTKRILESKNDNILFNKLLQEWKNSRAKKWILEVQ